MYTIEDFKQALIDKNQQLVFEIIHSETFDEREAGDHNLTPVHFAAFFGNFEAVELLKAKGAYMDEDDKAERTPLHIAAMRGHKKIFEFLVSCGALLNSEDKYNKQPLYYAVMKGHAEVVKFLTEKGADIEATTERGNTPLHLAALKGHTEIVKLLIEKGADIEATNERGNTPLHLAEMKGHIDTVIQLLEAGAIIDIDTVIQLLEAGAKIDHIDTEGIESDEIKQIIEGLKVIEAAKKDNKEPFEDEVVASILAFSQDQDAARIIINRTKNNYNKVEGGEFLDILKAITTIIHKAVGNCQLVNSLSIELYRINQKYMGIAEALANIITAKPMQIEMLEDIRSQKISEIEADKIEADDFLKENPFLKLIYSSCYGKENHTDPRNINYYNLVTRILADQLSLERDGVELTLVEALVQTKGAVEIGRHLTALEQATANVVLTAPLKELLDNLKSHCLALEESANKVDIADPAFDEELTERSTASAVEEQLSGKKVKRSEYEARHQDSEEDSNSEAPHGCVASHEELSVLGAELDS